MIVFHPSSIPTLPAVAVFLKSTLIPRRSRTWSNGGMDTGADVLAEALGVGEDTAALVTREQLGDGLVSGFDVTAPVARSEPLRYYLDTSRLPVREETGLALGDPDAPEMRIWLHPADPHLPVLAAFAYPDAAATVLARLGISADQPVPEFVAYRPGRRAVLRVTTADGQVWVKVVRPDRVHAVVRKHTACEAAGIPIPRLLGWSPEGVIVLAQATGEPAVARLDDPATLIDEVERLQEALGRVVIATPARSIAARLGWYAERLGALSDAEDVAGLVREVGDAHGATIPGNPAAQRVIHGDLHLGQLFVDNAGRVTGLIDVDTLGLGNPAEDTAAFIAHAIATARLTVDVARRRHLWRVIRHAHVRWAGRAGVPACTAIQLLGHALGAHHLGDADTGNRLIDDAKNALMGASPCP